MRVVTRVAVGIALCLAILFLIHPVTLAASRSISVSVSCVVVPAMQLSVPSAGGQAASDATVSTNMGKDFTITEEMKQTSDGMVKQVSITLL